MPIALVKIGVTGVELGALAAEDALVKVALASEDELAEVALALDDVLAEVAPATEDELAEVALSPEDVLAEVALASEDVLAVVGLEVAVLGIGEEVNVLVGEGLDVEVFSKTGVCAKEVASILAVSSAESCSACCPGSTTNA